MNKKSPTIIGSVEFRKEPIAEIMSDGTFQYVRQEYAKEHKVIESWFSEIKKITPFPFEPNNYAALGLSLDDHLPYRFEFLGNITDSATPDVII